MYSKDHPFCSFIKERALLTREGSTKKTYHISLGIEESVHFQVGDSVAVIPSNDPEMVESILKKLKVSPEEEILDPKTALPIRFFDFLLKKANLERVFLHKLYPVEKRVLPLIDLVKEHRPSPSELSRVLLPLMPRFYSIASSPKVFPHEIHLTVALVEYFVEGSARYGVGTHFLCQRAEIGSTSIPIYIQPSNHFSLPEDPSASIICIGPGTGIAPFRSFVQERLATNACGRNWIFFGERNQQTDFYYEDFWEDLAKQGRIRLSTAFSRDQPDKIYVQHKMLEEKKSLWNWIQSGSFIYVCGDAKEMAKDVERTLLEIFKEEGSMNEGEARAYLKELRQNKRYLLDVY